VTQLLELRRVGGQWLFAYVFLLVHFLQDLMTKDQPNPYKMETVEFLCEFF
jgi:hypothetical protein